MELDTFEIALPSPYAVTTDGTENVRSPGVHLSDILRPVAVSLKLLDDTQTYSPLFAHCGIAWENYLAQLIEITAEKDRMYIFHPGELVVDGIAMSPDMLEIADDVVVVHEFKFTWKSMKRPIEKEWLWLAQTKGYCRGVDTTLAMIHILHCNGTYSPPEPHFVTHRLVFTPHEIESNWSMVLRERERATNAR